MESVYSQFAWLIPLFPLIAFLILISLGRQLKNAGSLIGISATLISFIFALLIVWERLGGAIQDYTWSGMEWIKISDYSLTMGFEVTNLNALMLFIVTLVSLVVNIYSRGYMHGDERINVFFAYVALFTSAMLGVVISANILELYIFWELVGLGSFLLIGFWYFKPEAKAAAQKAFIMTRIGDVGLFIAILLLFWNMPGHALDFTSIHNAISDHRLSQNVITWIALLIFVGAVGKSGQFPLHSWLPDAMEGPTPISALIHAATMVAAGVYLVARTYTIFEASSTALEVVAYVGGFTAIFAATIGIAQNDIKRVLAYSTVSQLGYMMLALGVGAYTAGMFHLLTHAFFKALLFLAAGSVIHAVHTQDIHKMGGLAKKMKITTWTFAIGALSLSGIPPFSGFWSKDAILGAAYADNQLLFWLGLIAAFFTALYMSRLFFLVFTGAPKGEHAAHESPAVMTVPLIILAALAAVAGFIHMPGNEWLPKWLGDTAKEPVNYGIMGLSVVVGLLGIFLGWWIYGKRAIASDVFVIKARGVHKLLLNKYYIDEIYSVIIVAPIKIFSFILNLIDDFIVDGIVRLVSYLSFLFARVGNRMQNGQVQSYGLIMVIGFVLFIVLLVGRRFVSLG